MRPATRLSATATAFSRMQMRRATMGKKTTTSPQRPSGPSRTALRVGSTPRTSRLNSGRTVHGARPLVPAHSQIHSHTHTHPSTLTHTPPPVRTRAHDASSRPTMRRKSTRSRSWPSAHGCSRSLRGSRPPPLRVVERAQCPTLACLFFGVRFSRTLHWCFSRAMVWSPNRTSRDWTAIVSFVRTCTLLSH